MTAPVRAPVLGSFSLGAPVLPLPGQFDRILGRCLVDVPALVAFEDPQIRTIATGFDASQHRAAPARRAERPQHRNWFETRISFGHVMLLRMGGCMRRPADSTRFGGYDGASMAHSTAGHRSILLIFPENCRRRLGSGLSNIAQQNVETWISIRLRGAISRVGNRK
jgi:hypothetical protein